MKINQDKMKEAQNKALEILNKEEDKSQAIIKAVETLSEAKYEDLINELKEQSSMVEKDQSYAKKLGLRTSFSKEEKDFYTMLKDVKNAITAEQIDIIPTSIIDLTLEDIKEKSGILNDVNFAPADVKNWLVGEKNGTFAWNKLDSELVEELTATIKGMKTDVNKLYAVLIIPKGVRELSLPFVDKYFTAILNEALNDGLEFAYLQGTGLNQPIGIYKQIKSVNEDGTHKDKEVNTNLTKFTPKGMAEAKKYLIKGGVRKLNKLVIYCHPNDKADYVDPAIYNDKGELITSFKNLEVKDSIQNPEGKAALVIPKKYTMGLTGLQVDEYKETKALDDADVIIGKGYANGRAVDDNVAFVFDVTKLEEYIPTVKTKEEVAGA
ncbi:MAG: phage major capsid protein [Clostridia bacterium]|nr:phage major capsid protein [Clostridia bacterium]